MKALRIGIYVLIAFSVLAFGTVEVWSESILECGAALLLSWWAVLFIREPEREIHWPALCWPMLAFVCLVSAQLLLHGSAYAFLTRVALLKFGACALLFFLAIQVFRSRRALRQTAWFLILFGFAVAVFGIAQNFTSHYVLYWSRHLTAGGNPFGPYVNRNDFAGLMEMLIPIGLGLLLCRGVRREQMGILIVLTIVPMIALLLTGSRGGIASLIFEVVLLFVLVRRKAHSIRALAGVALLLAAVAIVSWMGANRALDRFAGSRFHDIAADRRVSMLRGAWHVFLSNPLTGTGLGTLVAVYPRFETQYDGRIVDHAHNDYAELLSETGILGGICGVLFLWFVFHGAVRRLRVQQSSFSRGLHLGAVTACAGMLMHSFVDFNLHIPANGLIFLVMSALAVSPAVLRVKPPSTPDYSSYMTSEVDIPREHAP